MFCTISLELVTGLTPNLVIAFDLPSFVCCKRILQNEGPHTEKSNNMLHKIDDFRVASVLEVPYEALLLRRTWYEMSHKDC